jgi:hypothetical protein
MSMGTFFSNLLARDSLESAIDTSESVDELIRRLHKVGRPVRDFPFAFAGALASEGRVGEALSVLMELDHEWRQRRTDSSATGEDLACLFWMQGQRERAVELLHDRWSVILNGGRAWFGDCGVKLFALRLYFAVKTGRLEGARLQLTQAAEYFSHVPVDGWKPFARFVTGDLPEEELFSELFGSPRLDGVRKSVWRAGGTVQRAHVGLILVAGIRACSGHASEAHQVLLAASHVRNSFCDIVAALVRSELLAARCAPTSPRLE